MARLNTRGLVLTFHKGSGRWCKVIDGKRRYFGYGKNVSDRQSYQAAVVNFDAWKNSQARAQENTVAEFLAARGTTPPEGYTVADLISGKVVADLRADIAESIKNPLGFLGYYQGQPQTAAGNGNTVESLWTVYLDDCKKRVARSESFGEQMPEKQRMGWQNFQKIENQSKPFLAMCAKMPMPKTANQDADDDAITSMVIGFRAKQEALLTVADKKTGKISPSTFNARLSIVRAFLNWAVDNRHIRALPPSRCWQMYTPNENQRALTNEEIKALWDVSDRRSKAYMAIALNCAFYAVDISQMTTDQIKDGYLMSYRTKKKVARKFKLWQITKDLIALEGNKDGLIFTTRNGQPIIHQSKTTRTDSVRLRFNRDKERAAKTVASCADIVFSNFRDTTSTRATILDVSVKDQILSHKDRSTASFYNDITPDNMDTTRLDAVLDKLESDYGLALPKDIAKDELPEE